MGSGVAILIGGGVLHAIEMGALAATPLASFAPWRMVMLVIGGPGLLWAIVILLIREPLRQTAEGESAGAGVADGGTWRATPWARVVPIYIVLAAASFVDNAVGAWAPTLLIRDFGKDPAQIGVELGLLLTVGFGGGVLIGGAPGRPRRGTRRMATQAAGLFVFRPVDIAGLAADELADFQRRTGLACRCTLRCPAS